MEEKKYTADSIQTLEGIVHVRLRPQMYFQECFDKKNLNALVSDSLCHAVDEYFDGICNEISIRINGNIMVIEYNAGMSLETSNGLTKAECIMTKIGACSNEKKHLEVGAEFCHLGMATVNAVTDKCEVKTIWNKKQGYFIFEKGYTTFKEILTSKNSKDSTQISFEMSKGIFGELEFEWEDLQLRLNSLREKLPNLKIELYKLS
ncbi:hypothetical protein LIV57_08175 [Chryseobacterium sp. X308]|uniref:hypothetical protein n=1 Tax=Chryseobacterium sp. X308 TaxID=2884873 RepID=UPI001D15AA5D|nr:hypothetical protein [Chryseobacterium sp. X308]MCC3215251.1 hypothetical protein [Chryseobacterium sp. X308]